MGGKLSRCSSYPAAQILNGREIHDRDFVHEPAARVTTIGFRRPPPAAVILRVCRHAVHVVSVSVNQARFRFCNSTGIVPVILEKISRSQRRDGAWLWNA